MFPGVADTNNTHCPELAVLSQVTSQPFYLIILGPELGQGLETTMPQGHCPYKAYLPAITALAAGPEAQRQSHQEGKILELYVPPTKTPSL